MTPEQNKPYKGVESTQLLFIKGAPPPPPPRRVLKLFLDGWEYAAWSGLVPQTTTQQKNVKFATPSKTDFPTFGTLFKTFQPIFPQKT